MNVLQVVPELNAGGVERTTVEIAEALMDKGVGGKHNAHIASQGGRLEEELQAIGAILHKLNIGSKNPLLLRANTKALIKIIKENNIDIVHARSRAPAWPAKAAAKATGKIFITTYHGIYNAKSGLKRRYNAIMAKGDLVIANSNFTKAHIIKEHGIDEDKIRVIPRGVDIERFNPEVINPDAIKHMRQAWGVKQAERIILLPGRLTRWKGQILAIKAMKLLKAKNTKLVLLGDAQGREDYLTELNVLIEAKGLQDRVYIAAHTNDMPTALLASDIVISPSTDPEAFGRVMVEAQAMQRLVAASNHGGSCETIIDGETGILVPVNQEKPLANAIDDILALDKKAYQVRAKRARAHILQNFSSKAMKNATLDVYQQALNMRQ